LLRVFVFTLLPFAEYLDLLFLHVSCADLNGKVFLFPKQSTTDYVTVIPSQSQPLSRVSVCLRYYSPLFYISLFSLATKNQHNAFLMYPYSETWFYFYVGHQELCIRVDKEPFEWNHVCSTWNSDTGVIQLWINGKLYPRLVAQKGFTIPVPQSMILGQEQDSCGGGFVAQESFAGEMTDFHMWNYVLSLEQIHRVFQNQHVGNVLSWSSLTFQIYGAVLVQPKIQCHFQGVEYLGSHSGACSQI
uniref:Pentraxin family member n=1 Tax=Leptobrachium leishanense TaxID=445787 RepID=A0A8C5QMQ2_9ANUR